MTIQGGCNLGYTKLLVKTMVATKYGSSGRVARMSSCHGWLVIQRESRNSRTVKRMATLEYSKLPLRKTRWNSKKLFMLPGVCIHFVKVSKKQLTGKGRTSVQSNSPTVPIPLTDVSYKDSKLACILELVNKNKEFQCSYYLEIHFN